MATAEELGQALINAHNAGDDQAARTLADALHGMQAGKVSAPGATQANPLDDTAHAAGAGTIARASLAPDPQVQLKRYAEAFKQPLSDFGIVGDHIVRRIPNTDQYARVQPSVRGAEGPIDAAERAFDWVASGAGPAIPAIASGAGAAAAGIAGLVSGPGALAAAAAGGAGGAASGEIARQKLDAVLAPKGEETPMDYGNVGWQALAGAAGPLVGKGLSVAAGRVAPVLAQAAADELPAAATAARAALTEGTAPVAGSAATFGLSPRMAAALREHIAGRQAEMDQLRQEAQELGVDLSLDQITGSKNAQYAVRQLARTPEGADVVDSLRRAQNEEQIPGAVRKVLDDVAPDAPAGKQVAAFREGADSVVEAANAERAAKADPIYKAAFKANPSVQSPLIDKILDTPDGKEALQWAVRRMQNRMSRVANPDADLTEQLRDAVARGQASPSEGGVAAGLKLETLDLVKQGLWDAEDALRKRVVNGTARAGEVDDIAALRRAFTKELDRLDVTAAAGPNSTKAEGGLYQQARGAFGDPSDDIDAMLQGGVGFLQRMSGPDRQNMVTRVFSGQNLMPDEIAAMRRQFAYAGKSAEWNGGVRSYVADKLANAMKPTKGGELSNVGGAMYQGLWGDQRQADVMRAALGGGADDALMARWDKLGRVLRAAAHQLPEGSPTVTDAGSPGLVRGALHGAKMIVSPSEAVKTGADMLDSLAKLQDPENAKKLAGYLLTPEGDKLLKALQPTTPGTPKAHSILATMLTQAGVVEAEQRAAH